MRTITCDRCGAKQQDEAPTLVGGVPEQPDIKPCSLEVMEGRMQHGCLIRVQPSIMTRVDLCGVCRTWIANEMQGRNVPRPA